MLLVAVVVVFRLLACNAVDVHINSEDVEKLLQLEWTLLEGIIEPTEAAAATTENAAATVAEAEVVRQDILEFQPPFRPEMVEHPLNVNILKKLVPSLT